MGLPSKVSIIKIEEEEFNLSLSLSIYKQKTEQYNLIIKNI